jgi:hypothetical protein
MGFPQILHIGDCHRQYCTQFQVFDYFALDFRQSRYEGQLKILIKKSV